MQLHRFPGGVRPARHKPLGTAVPIVECPLPPHLVIPLAQHIGAPAQCVVVPGQHVARGEPVGHAVGERSASVHASTSGRIVAIEPRPLPRSDGQTGPCVVLEPDGDDRWQYLPALTEWRTLTRDVLLARIAAAGIVGLGGAAFPSAAKLAVPRRVLVLNGAECEPYIACDDHLMRERAGDIVDGAFLLRRISGAEQVIIALEDSMADALAAIAAAIARVGDAAISCIAVPTIYPAGGERQLIRVLTGREVPSGGLPRDIGVICHNVGTAYAAWRAVVHGEALTSRIVSVTGAGIVSPCTLDVRIGTPIAFVVAQAGGYAERAARLVVGGPMMGVALPHDDIPIVKASNCVLVLGDDDVRAPAPEQPCIRCGECMRVCPAQLLPQQLLLHIQALEWDAVREHALDDCIECGCCAYVCPSQIPLVDWYRHAKSEIAVHERDRARADHARERYLARGERLAREQAQRVARVADAPAIVDAPSPESMTTTAAPPVMDKDAVLAAVARAKAKKLAAQRAPARTPEPPAGEDTDG